MLKKILNKKISYIVIFLAFVFVSAAVPVLTNITNIPAYIDDTSEATFLLTSDQPGTTTYGGKCAGMTQTGDAQIVSCAGVSVPYSNTRQYFWIKFDNTITCTSDTTTDNGLNSIVASNLSNRSTSSKTLLYNYPSEVTNFSVNNSSVANGAQVSCNTNCVHKVEYTRAITTATTTTTQQEEFTLTVAGGTITSTPVKTRAIPTTNVSATINRIYLNLPATEEIYDNCTITVKNASDESTTHNIATFAIDKTAPTLSAVSIASDNSVNTSYAKGGEEITLSITASESIKKPTVTIAGQSADVTGSGASYQAKYTLPANPTAGVITFSITNIEDNAGNTAANVSTATSGSVTVDLTAPTITSAAIASNNTNTALAKIGDVITLTIAGSESITAPTVKIAGQDATVEAVAGSTSSYTAKYTAATSTPQGLASIEISGYTDLAGNAGAGRNATTSGSVTVDTVVPTITTATITSNNSNTSYAKVGDIITLSITGSETITAPTVKIAGETASVQAILGSTKSYTAKYTVASDTPQGEASIEISGFTDSFGNTGTTRNTTSTSASVTVDTTSPAINFTDNVLAGPVQSDSVVATATDTNTISTLQYKLIDQSICNTTNFGTTAGTAFTTGSTLFTQNTEANNGKYVCIKAVDIVGNIGYAGSSNDLNIDIVAPSLTQETAVPTPTNDTTPNYVFNTDEAGAITYGGSCASSTTSATSGENTITFNTLTAGTYTDCKITVTDSAGNASTALDVASFTIDTTAPSLTQETAVPTPTNDTTPNYVFNTDEAGAITYGGSCASSTTSATSGENTITFNTLTAGTYTDCKITVTDSAGNASTALEVSNFTIDTTAPTVTQTTAVPTPTNDTTPNYVFNSDEAGTISYGGSCESSDTTATNGENTVTFNELTAGTYTDCTVKVTDSAGNASTALPVSNFTVDITAPVFSSITATSNNAKNSSYAKVGDTLSFNLAISPADTWKQTTNTFNFNIGSSSDLSIGNYTKSDTPRTDENKSYTVLAGQNGQITAKNLTFQDAAGNNITGFSNGYSVLGGITVDTIVPTTTISTNKTSLKKGEKAEITITFSEEVSGFVVGDITALTGGSSAGGSFGNLTTDDNIIYKVEYTPAQNYTDVVAIKVAANVASDNAGNQNTAATSQNISVDTKDPTITTATITSNNSNTSYAKVGDEITLSITGSETITKPTVKIAGETASVQAILGSTTSYKAKYTIASDTPQGEASIEISGFTDSSGNTGTTRNTTSTSASVTVDTTSPAINFTDNVLAGPVQSDSVVATATDTNTISTLQYKLIDQSICNTTNFGTTAGTAFTTGSTLFTQNTEANNGKYVCIKAVDIVGNVGYAGSSNDLNIDITKPQISISGPSSDTVATDSFTITITETNPDTSKNLYGYADSTTCDLSVSTPNSYTSAEAINISTDENNGKYICVKSEDQAGNIEYKSSTNNLNINLAPTDINLSNDTVIENKISENVGTLSTIDASANPANTFVYSFVSGDGDSDNSAFSINGDLISIKNSADFEAQDTYSVRINVNDGLTNFAKVFEIKVEDVAEGRSVKSSSSSSSKKVCKDQRATNYEKKGLHRQNLCKYDSSFFVIETIEKKQETIDLTDQVNVEKVKEEIVRKIENLIKEILSKIISRLTKELTN